VFDFLMHYFERSLNTYCILNLIYKRSVVQEMIASNKYNFWHESISVKVDTVPVWVA
jgi:hypothetical protein